MPTLNFHRCRVRTGDRVPGEVTCRPSRQEAASLWPPGFHQTMATGEEVAPVGRVCPGQQGTEAGKNPARPRGRARTNSTWKKEKEAGGSRKRPAPPCRWGVEVPVLQPQRAGPGEATLLLHQEPGLSLPGTSLAVLQGSTPLQGSCHGGPVTRTRAAERAGEQAGRAGSWRGHTRPRGGCPVLPGSGRHGAHRPTLQPGR